MEIAQLTLGQLNVYLKYWVGATEKKDGDDAFSDLELFNLTAGIPKKYVKKQT